MMVDCIYKPILKDDGDVQVDVSVWLHFNCVVGLPSDAVFKDRNHILKKRLEKDALQRENS